MTNIQEFDHSVIAVNDLLLAQRFYDQVLGEIVGSSSVEPPTHMTTEEIIRAGRLREVMAERDADRPGGQDRGFRVSAPHGGVKVGEALIPMFLYTEHVQEPPPEQLKGTPRLALHVSDEQLDRAQEVFRRHKVPYQGPVEHAPPAPISRSVYFKDPSSNFLELCVAQGS